MTGHLMVDKIKKIILVLVSLLFLPAFVLAAAESIYVAQSQAGGNTGADCSNAHSISWLNSSGNWNSSVDTADGYVGPGDTVHLCSTDYFTTALNTAGAGTSGHPITILFDDRCHKAILY